MTRKFIFSSIPFLLGILLLAVSGYSQQAFVKVIDSRTHEVVPFSHVCFEGMKNGSQKHFVTDMNGKVINDVKEMHKVAVSFIGYETKYDTIRPGQNLEIQLKPIMLNLAETVVTAQYTPEKADKSIYPVNVISTRQIEQKGATNLTDILKSQPGMYINYDPSLGSSLTLQGLTGENIKFLEDGIPVTGRMNGNIDISQINLYNVDHIEIIEGPMSVIYGSNAMAGVINLITKENKIYKLNTSFNSYYESVGVYNFDGSLSLRKGKSTFSLDAARNFFGGYSPQDTSRAKTFKPKRQFFSDAYYLYTGKDYRVKFTGQYFNELLLNKGPLQPPYFENAFDSYFTTLKYGGAMDLSKSIKKHHSFSLTASWSEYERIKKTYYKNLTTLEQVLTPNPDDQDTSTIVTWMVRTQIMSNNPDHKINYQTGLDLNNERGTGKRILGNAQDIGEYAGFVSMKYDPWTFFSIQPGARFIYNTKYKAPVVYALSLKWEPYPDFVIRPSFSRGFRSPTTKELYLDFVDVNHRVFGNPDLKAETSNNVNVDFNYKIEEHRRAFSIDLKLYMNRVMNGIDLAMVPEATGGGNVAPYRYFNVEEYRTKGFLFSANANFYPHLSLTVSMAESGRYNKLNDISDQPETYYYTPDMSSEVTYKFPKQNLNISLFYKYTGTTHQYALSETSILTSNIDPYHMMDFTVSKGLFQNRLRLGTGVKNIFDVSTLNASGDATGGAHSGGNNPSVDWGRTVFVRLSFQFNKYKSDQ